MAGGKLLAGLFIACFGTSYFGLTQNVYLSAYRLFSNTGVSAEKLPQIAKSTNPKPEPKDDKPCFTCHEGPGFVNFIKALFGGASVSYQRLKPAIGTIEVSGSRNNTKISYS